MKPAWFCVAPATRTELLLETLSCTQPVQLAVGIGGNGAAPPEPPVAPPLPPVAPPAPAVAPPLPPAGRPAVPPLLGLSPPSSSPRAAMPAGSARERDPKVRILRITLVSFHRLPE